MADIIILKGSFLEGVSYRKYLGLTEEEMIELVVDGYSFLSSDEKYYGIKIHENGREGGMLSEYITYTSKGADDEIIDDDYYMFIRKDSLHMGKYNDNELDGAISVIRKMFGYEN